MSAVTRVLVVEDDPDIAQLVAHYLDKAGFSTEVLSSGRDALAAIAARPPDLLVLDLMLPQVDGLEDLPRRAVERDDGRHSDHHADGARRGIRSHRRTGAGRRRLPREAVQSERARRARPRAAAPRETQRAAGSGSAIAYGSIAIDPERHTITDAGASVALTAKEFLLLEYLLQHRGRVLSRDVLLTDVWGYRYTGGTRTVDVHVRRLREKLPLLAKALDDRQAVRLQAPRFARTTND